MTQRSDVPKYEMTFISKSFETIISKAISNFHNELQSTQRQIKREIGLNSIYKQNFKNEFSLHFGILHNCLIYRWIIIRRR